MFHDTKPWNPNVPHCSKEARGAEFAGQETGGHAQCLTELSADGSCPREWDHHDLWIAAFRERTTCTPGSHLATCKC